MSMDEMLLNELYGSEQVQNDEQIKQAQVELVEAVAAEAGVDLNELDDDELAKFAHYVLTDEDEEGVEYADDMNKLAEADLMGRQMAHSYYDELAQLQAGADEMDYTQVKIASAMEDVAEAWEMQKIAETPEAAAEEAKEAKEAFGARMKRYGTNAGKFTGILGTEGENYFGKRGLRLGGTAAGLAALGGGAYYMNKRRKANQEKSASVADMLAYELEKIAETPEAAPEKVKEAFGQRMKRYGTNAGKFTGVLETDGEKFLGKRGLRLGGTAAGLAALGGGAYYMNKRRKANQEKKASLFLDAGYEALAIAELCEPEEFAKEAEYRAAEILLANGVDPATFENVYPEHVKIASFPGVEYATDEYEAAALEEYNDMLDTAAMHIIDNLLD